MYYSLTGKLIYTDPQIAVIECGGVGYKCFVTQNTLRRLPPVGTAATLYTYLSVREDALDLYGFFEQTELSCYKLLISVNGVGARVALSLLSDFTPEKIALCIATGDSKTLTRASGVGAKLAQRVVLELKDKIGSVGGEASEDFSAAGAASAAGNAGEAVSALVVLGYSQSEASLAVGRLDSSLPVEQLIRDALKSLVRKV